ncbi:PH domain-containing protein [Catellatospora sichuanensis]|uniref:PH domain-containing protein n=1 Tax=Catellatospora sichuanensis TaxID=1969805 RepID=UPI0011840BA3|nr:PH domain-containing protein [Catellatospora sichuanensis]
MSRESGPGDDLEFDPLTEDELEGLRLSPLPLLVLPLGDEPTRVVVNYLFPTERYRGEWRRHVVSPIKSLLVVAIYAGLCVTIAVQRIKPEYTAAVVAVLVAVFLLVAAHRVADWLLTRFVLTNRRLMLVRGVITRRVSMVPLLRVTDMHYLQSPLGRLLNYGTFQIDGGGTRGPLRRIADLPNPNELYLRIVEEIYEPSAVEARLGANVADAVQEALQGPPLVDYDGWIGVEVFDQDGPVPVSGSRRFAYDPARAYRMVVTIAPFPAGGVSEPLVVSGGVTEPRVRFEVEVDSDRTSLRRPALALPAWHDRAAAIEFSFDPIGEELTEPPWMWIRVTQGRRTLQSIELAAELRPGGREGG